MMLFYSIAMYITMSFIIAMHMKISFYCTAMQITMSFYGIVMHTTMSFNLITMQMQENYWWYINEQWNECIQINIKHR